MLEVGTKAPEFNFNDLDGNQVKLSDYKGKWVILYFYPKDNTPGCTNEACDFSEDVEAFSDANAEIIGISADSLTSHQKFIDKYNLKIKLLSDPDKEVIKLYQAWGEKKLYGKVSVGLIRTTYIINPEGEIAAGWSPVKVRGKNKNGITRHSDKVKEKLLDLKKK